MSSLESNRFLPQAPTFSAPLKPRRSEPILLLRLLPSRVSRPLLRKLLMKPGPLTPHRSCLQIRFMPRRSLQVYTTNSSRDTSMRMKTRTREVLWLRSSVVCSSLLSPSSSCARPSGCAGSTRCALHRIALRTVETAFLSTNLTKVTRIELWRTTSDCPLHSSLSQLRQSDTEE